MIDDIRLEYARYRDFVDKTLNQIDEEILNRIPVEDGNSIGMIIRHLHGNLLSRFTDFLTSDGEKEWRDREREFAVVRCSMQETKEVFGKAWSLLDQTLTSLSDEDLETVISIRGQELTVRAALLRSLSHFSYHVGQIVLLARMGRADAWDWITIPRGQSAAYNRNPSTEKGFESKA